MKKDYYKILGVNKNASAEDIKKAYRKLAHQYHPDRPGGNESKFKEINEAYQILSNQEKRRQYDQFGQTFAGGNGFGFDFNDFHGFGFDPSHFNEMGNVGDIFDAFFEGLGVKKRKTYHRGSDIEIGLSISLEEAFNGAAKTVSFDTFDACEKCSGIGHFAKEGFTKCAACDGRGEIRETRNSFFGNFSQIRNCGKCFGSGQIPNKKCADCLGSGRIRKRKTIAIDIAPGVHDGQIIKVTGAGEAGARGAAAGDLYVRISIKKHPVFFVKGDDLIMKKAINLVDVLLGKKIKIQTIAGKTIGVEIPAGANLNQELKVVGEGMPRFGSGGWLKNRGDLYIIFDIKTPKKLSSKAKKLLEELKKEI